MTSTTFPQHGSPGHQTRGHDLDEHLSSASDESDGEDGSTNGLLRGKNDGYGHRGEFIYASKEAQGQGHSAKEAASSDNPKRGLTAFWQTIVSVLVFSAVRCVTKRHQAPRTIDLYPLSFVF